MEEEKNQYQNVSSGQEGSCAEAEVEDRGLFDFMGKKEEKEKCHQEEVIVTGMENVHVTEEEKNEEEGEKTEGLLAKLHRSHSSSSSSSSDEEEGAEGDKKKKKKKGLKEKIKEKLGGEKEQEGEEVIKHTTVVVSEEEEVKVMETGEITHGEDTSITVEKVDETVKLEGSPHEEKKGFFDKIKEKLPGQKKPNEEAQAQAPAPAPVVCEEVSTPDSKEKKGIIGKIMEKLPGYNTKGAGEVKEGEKTGDCL